MENKQSLKLDLAYPQPQQNKLNNAVVTVPAFLVNSIYQQVLLDQKKVASPHGFQKGSTPLGYIEKNFKFNIIEHLKDFLFRYCVVSFLVKELRNNKIILAGEPRLININLELNKSAEFYFEFTPIEPINIEDWQYIIFRAPKRKNYKDLDKQAISFLKEEQSKKKEENSDKLDIGDWICFDISLVDDNHNLIVEDIKENLWLKIGDDEPSIPFQEIFINKKIGDKFYTNSQSIQIYFDTQINSNYTFLIEIQEIINKSFFSIDYLKEHFKLKANKNIHQKLIEVFSFRNDLSLRKVIVEELFDLLFTKFHFSAPVPAVLRQQNEILDVLQQNPDYPVYKMQKDFNERVQMLAQKQVKETILIDTICYHEDIQATHDDIKYYLNLANRARTKEFIYFQHPIIKANEQEYPLPSELLRQSCLREKTLNYVINTLSRD